ncbi:Phthiocerol synthesis polyketide synthase type I [Paramuricea clavata]|uniref:oleoyl-[acyl-carrier-protein] hydrolase n=1 Tax=Paramuricea clavata TaxID=317549 RepID=A0A7D9HP92_PARCT|nr:Phthiocerol synthesis polyketide synthase type I [Paramuricea clavata]
MPTVCFPTIGMPRQRIRVDWKTVDGAFSKPRRLHLENDKEGLFHCPAPGCEHDGFESQRGYRKHVKTKHRYIYFDTKPIISAESERKPDVNQSCSSGSKPTLPCCATNSQLARLFSSWLQSTTGGERQGKHAEISTNIALYGIGVDDASFEKSDYGTVFTLAQRYVDFIQKIQPRGPYYLAGYSFGGTVAYEMASELKREYNETVAMVFMVDTLPWFPKALTNCTEYHRKCGEEKLKSMGKLVTRQVIEKMAFVRLGVTRNEVDNLYENLGENKEVITALENQAAEKNLNFPLKEQVDTVLYELKSAAKAHNDWQPSKIYYEETITYVCSDETHLFSLWKPDIWKSLVERMEFLFVSGNHIELRDETRGKICGSMMMTTAAMKYQSAFSTFNLQAVRSRPQERLVESLKQGLAIWMLSSPSSSTMVKGTLWLNSEETIFYFEYTLLGRRKRQKIFIKGEL